MTGEEWVTSTTANTTGHNPKHIKPLLLEVKEGNLWETHPRWLVPALDQK
jgi:hypothetical protein